MNKIKVLYIIDTLEGYGAEKSLVEITSNFKHINPVFAHIYQGDMLKPRLEDAGVRVYSLDIRKKYAFNTAVKKLKAIYLQEKPDIIHATLFRSEIISRKLKQIFPQIYLVGSFVSNAYSGERFRKKGTLDKFKLAYFHNIDKRSAPLVNRFISNSETIKENTARALGIESNKVQVIYRGRKSANFDPLKVQGDLPYLNNQNQILLNVSRLIPLKGQMDLLKAMPQVIKNYPQIQLVFAGHGSYREYLERQSRKLGVQDHIRFLGRIDNIQKLLVKADIFLYPSYSEGLPGALIEAMMAERIIIASNILENLECVDENCALIYEKGNVQELASNILKVLKNPGNYQSMAQNARIKAIEKFELEKVVAEYEKFYLNAVPIKNVESGVVRKKTLKILHIIQKPQNRGAENFASQLANHQINNGNNVKLVSVFSGNANLPWKGGIESLDASAKLRFLDYKAWKKLNEIIKEFKPDIIQANAGDTLKYAVFSKKIFGWKIPIIFRNASEVGRYLNRNYQKEINSFFYKNISAVASVSKASKTDLLHHFLFLENKTEVIPIGLEKTAIQSSFIFPDNKKNIIHVGGFSFEKNHKGLIRIYKQVLFQQKNVCLHLVGDGALRDTIEKEVSLQDLQDKVKFYGFVDNALPMISKADVLVLPSIIEGLPGVLLEAMYCKTPVIAYNVGGISEIVNADTGILIEKDDENEFVKAVIQVLNEDNTSRIEKAHKLVLKNYLNESLVQDFDKLYKKVIGS
ncbi:glycosyltransferase [Salegentibacter flavus]|uniref:Glycosyltransferase involved in cell wall bisynthesis n=1 Tax=Salegentibacter flavus TaxID=287099 RepID=A0A1I5BGH8_9FLAO|nr:glycosyltransferase [Salegentibacter flavus]SFN73782.1 Glycosyltransferase involved in cell wall bisynthesis [Salegentibacter flavus]